jgi:hypothetical protein
MNWDCGLSFSRILSGVFAAGISSWSLARGLTRQLRTVPAPPPEPLPRVGRVLRVSVVANGSKEHPLPGAQQEARLLLDLFDSCELPERPR